MFLLISKTLQINRGWKSLHECYPAAKMKHHPDIIKIPNNFRWHRHAFDHQALPRGTSGKPMNFVLTVLFYNQPCKLENLWSKCLEVPGIPLDSRRHLRQVTHQARMEGWVYFEKKEDSHWYVYFSPDRYEEINYLVSSWRNDWLNTISGNDGQDVAFTSLQKVNTSSETKMKSHMDHVRKALVDANQRLNNFERTTIEYLPYTDPNGKVNFMWWYEMAVGGKNSSEITETNEAPRDVNVSGLSPLARSI